MDRDKTILLIVGLIVLVFLIGKNFGLFTAYPPNFNSIPIDDAHIRSSGVNDNYGTLGRLEVNGYNPDITFTLLKFQIDSSSANAIRSGANIDIAEVYLYTSVVCGGEFDGMELNVFTYPNNWDEETVTWANSPDQGNLIVKVNIPYHSSSSEDGFIKIPLNNYIKNVINTGANQISLALAPTSAMQSRGCFLSKEGSNIAINPFRQPYLALTVGTAVNLAPTFSSVILDKDSAIAGESITASLISVADPDGTPANPDGTIVLMCCNGATCIPSYSNYDFCLEEDFLPPYTNVKCTGTAIGTGTQTVRCALYDYDKYSTVKSDTYTIGTCSPADTNCDNKVSDIEILAYISKWINNQITDAEVLSGITSWIHS